MLRGVRVLNEEGRNLLDFRLVDRIVIRNGWPGRFVFSPLPPAQDRVHEGMAGRVISPILRLQIDVHKKSAECEMAQYQPAPDMPSLQPIDGISRACKIALDRRERIVLLALEGKRSVRGPAHAAARVLSTGCQFQG